MSDWSDRSDRRDSRRVVSADPRYKLPLKAFIRDFTGDEAFYRYKVKVSSVQNAWGYEMGICSNMTLIRWGKYSSSITRLAEKYGDRLSLKYNICSVIDSRVQGPSSSLSPAARNGDFEPETLRQIASVDRLWADRLLGVAPVNPWDLTSSNGTGRRDGGEAEGTAVGRCEVDVALRTATHLLRSSSQRERYAAEAKSRFGRSTADLIRVLLVVCASLLQVLQGWGFLTGADTGSDAARDFRVSTDRQAQGTAQIQNVLESDDEGLSTPLHVLARLVGVELPPEVGFSALGSPFSTSFLCVGLVWCLGAFAIPGTMGPGGYSSPSMAARLSKVLWVFGLLGGDFWGSLVGARPLRPRPSAAIEAEGNGDDSGARDDTGIFGEAATCGG